MIERRGFLNFTKVSDQEYNDFMENEDLSNDKYKFEKIMYIIIFIIYNFVFITALFWFYKLRDSYIIRQRNFKLTFIGGIITFICAFIAFLPQITNIPCAINIYNINFLSVLLTQIFFSRSIRVILSYKMNIYKVTSLKNEKRKNTFEKEPNNYLPKICKKIDLIVVLFIVIPSLIALLAEIIIHAKNYDKCRFSEIGNNLQQIKQEKNNNGKYYYVIRVFGGTHMILGFITAIALLFVKDANKYGVKFECLSTSILILICEILNALIQSQIANTRSRFILDIYNITKGGKILFNLIAVYILFTSILLPIIHYYKAKSEQKKYFQEPLSSIQYFYRVLNTPALVNELRNIAIKEFSVENVLFWDNYQILQKMIYRYQIEYEKAKEMNDERYISQYDFESYYQQQILGSHSSSSIESYTYDPNMAIPREIMPYFKSFYYTFINYDGPAAVNITSHTITQIQREMFSHPTVGIFDMAKNEVVELMFTTIFPILLRNNKRDFNVYS